MIGVVLGTTGELIKLAPILLALQERGQPALVLTTAQQVEQLPPFMEDFGLPAAGGLARPRPPRGRPRAHLGGPAAGRSPSRPTSCAGGGDSRPGCAPTAARRR